MSPSMLRFKHLEYLASGDKVRTYQTNILQDGIASIAEEDRVNRYQSLVRAQRLGRREATGNVGLDMGRTPEAVV